MCFDGGEGEEELAADQDYFQSSARAVGGHANNDVFSVLLV